MHRTTRRFVQPVASRASVAPLDRYLARASDAPQSYSMQLQCAAVVRERELHYCALYLSDGPDAGRAPASNAESWAPWPITPSALDQLERLRAGIERPGPTPFDLFGVKGQVTDALATTLRPGPSHAVGRALCRQFEMDLGRPLPRGDESPTLAPWNDPMLEAWARVAHNARVEVEGLGYLRHCFSDRDLARAAQRDLHTALASADLPTGLASLRDLAALCGVGDDGLRAFALATLGRARRRAMVERVRAVASDIDTFTRDFGSGYPAPAVAAFFYLRLAAEDRS